MEMSDEEFNPFKKGVSSHRNVHRGAGFEGKSPNPSGYSEPQTPRTHNMSYQDGDPYERDENGRPVGFKRGSGGVVRRRPASDSPGLKPFLVIGGVFSAMALLSGQLSVAALVAGMTFFVYVLSRFRR
jgi:hypothetical protein